MSFEKKRLILETPHQISEQMIIILFKILSIIETCQVEKMNAFAILSLKLIFSIFNVFRLVQLYICDIILTFFAIKFLKLKKKIDKWSKNQHVSYYPVIDVKFCNAFQWCNLYNKKVFTWIRTYILVYSFDQSIINCLFIY